MQPIETAKDLLRLRESVDVEFKTAAGRDGMGAVPESMWETYSAFANTVGGVIFLGVAEQKSGEPLVVGIEDVDKVLDELFSIASDPDQVSVNLFNQDTVRERILEGWSIIEIHVPAVPPSERPVFLNGSAVGNSYFRDGEKDLHFTDEEVREMLG